MCPFCTSDQATEGQNVFLLLTGGRHLVFCLLSFFSLQEGSRVTFTSIQSRLRSSKQTDSSFWSLLKGT